MNESDEELLTRSEEEEPPKQTASYTAYIQNLKHFVQKMK